MPTIDFYLLPDNACYPLIFKLGEKIQQQASQAFILLDTPAEVNQLDDFLWTYRDTSFLPHAIYPTETAAPLCLSHTLPEASFCPILINLSRQITPQFSTYSRIIEIVTDDETSKALGREHFRFYREQGFEIKTHRL